MIINEKKLNKIGIDRIVLNNFKISNFDSLDKKEINSSREQIQKIEKKTDLFNLTYSVVIQDNNELYTASSLEINPNRIRDGNNIYNSTVKELNQALKQIMSMLLKLGIELDLSEAKVKEIEINTTFETNFADLTEVLFLIGRANYKNSLGMYSFNKSNVPTDIRVERSLYINSKSNEIKGVAGKTIKFYDKTFELKRNHDIEIPEKLTRVELLAPRDFYRYHISKYGLTNSLKDLKDEVLHDMFIKALETEVLVKPTNYLEVIKKNLIYDFLNFKRNEKVKREERKRLKALAKEVPERYKETKGVFKYLDKESWIFDYSFLQELVLTTVEAKSREHYYKQIEKKYIKKRNKSIYEKLLKSIFLR